MPPVGPARCTCCGAFLEAGGPLPDDRGSVRPGRWCAACEQHPPDPYPGLFVVDPPIRTPYQPELPETSAPTLRDPRLDALLRRQGFVLVPEPILTPEEAHALREEFGALHHWRGEGHLNDFNHRDHGYRERATTLMIDALLPAIEPLFVDHEPFLSTFLC